MNDDLTGRALARALGEVLGRGTVGGHWWRGELWDRHVPGRHYPPEGERCGAVCVGHVTGNVHLCTVRGPGHEGNHLCACGHGWSDGDDRHGEHPSDLGGGRGTYATGAHRRTDALTERSCTNQRRDSDGVTWHQCARNDRVNATHGHSGDHRCRCGKVFY